LDFLIRQANCGLQTHFRGKVLHRKNYTDKKLDQLEWTLAPFTMYLGIEGKIPNINHHNYFLGNNFKEYAENIFDTAEMPDKPYYYVNVSSKSNPACAPVGHENMFVLCPVPDLRYKDNWDDAEQLADNIITDIGNRLKIDLHSKIVSKTILSPRDWEQKFQLYQGSGLGLAHGLNQVGGFRPSNKDEEFENLFYVGASTVPGTGLPMVIKSSKLVTERVIKQYETVQ
jgi:phytoene desaturase